MVMISNTNQGSADMKRQNTREGGSWRAHRSGLGSIYRKGGFGNNFTLFFFLNSPGRSVTKVYFLAKESENGDFRRQVSRVKCGQWSYKPSRGVQW